MIIVHGTFPVKVDVRDDALELMRQMADASKEEEGCVSYEFYVGLTDPNTLLLFQEWESVDALQGHFETDHMEEFLKLLPSFLDGEVASRRYEVRVNNGLFEAGDFDPEQVYIKEEREKIIH
jgi:quinol monooxygenase YgiN